MKTRKTRTHPATLRPKTPAGTAERVQPLAASGSRVPGNMGAVLAWAGWALVMTGILASNDFHIVFRPDMSLDPRIPITLIPWAIASGSILMALGFHILPDRKIPDIGRGPARLLLSFFLGASGFLLFYSGDAPMGPFWSDWSQNVIDARNLLDSHIGFLVYHAGGREGFHVTLIAALWWLFPFLKGLMVLRIASGLVVLFTVWVSYLIGKELGSRRIGLILAALVAAGKPLLQQALAGMRIETQVLASAIVILMFLRTARRPSIGHFLACGLALGLGVYTYTGFRSWILLLPFLFLVWALTRPGELRAGWQATVLPVLVLWLHVHTFIGRHLDGRVPLYSPAADLWRGHAWVRWTFFLFLLGVLLQALKVLHRKRTGVWTTGWSLGVLLMLACIYPATLDAVFAKQLSRSSFLVSPEFHSAPVAHLIHKVDMTLRGLFVLGEDRGDLALGNEPYLDFYTMAAVILGLALLAGRPGRKGWFFLLLALAGMVPHVLSSELTSTKIIGAVLPLCVLGAMAVDRLLAGSALLKPRLLTGHLALGVLFLLFGAGVWIQFQKFHVLWVNETGPDVALGRQVRQLTQQGKRVYLATQDCFWGGNAQALINEGRLYYWLMRSNVIELNDGEPLPPVVLLVNPGAKEDIRDLRGEFPRASWVPVPRVSRNGGQSTPCQILRLELTGKDLTEDPHRLIHIKRTVGRPWVRRYYGHEYGLYGRDYVLIEDRSARMSDPVDPTRMKDPFYRSFKGLHTVRVFGNLMADRDGVHRLQWAPQRHIWVRVDGRLIADIPPRPSASRDASVPFKLKAGNHPVEIGVHFADDYELPPVFLTRPGAPSPEML